MSRSWIPFPAADEPQNNTSIGETRYKCDVGGLFLASHVGTSFLIERSGGIAQEAGWTAVRVFFQPNDVPTTSDVRGKNI